MERSTDRRIQITSFSFGSYLLAASLIFADHDMLLLLAGEILKKALESCGSISDSVNHMERVAKFYSLRLTTKVRPHRLANC